MKASSLLLLCGTMFATIGCGRVPLEFESVAEPAPVIIDKTEMESLEQEIQADVVAKAVTKVEQVHVRGVYISAYVAGTEAMMDQILTDMEQTQVNAVVIDLKDDFGRVVCEMDSPMVTELDAVKLYIADIESLMQKLKEKDIYVIARVPAFRDSWLSEKRPDLCIYQDSDGNGWLNPYKQEVWDYLVEIGIEAKKLGFDEIQFDYVRFCTEQGMADVVFDEADVKGRSKTDIITEFMAYVYQDLHAEGLFVSADVFGAIINSDINAQSVGQIYGDLAQHLDYISPMIYPSHYSDGNYGIEHPDTQPYDTIMAALAESKKELDAVEATGTKVAVVRPWLQDFTASWLEHHILYDADAVKAQIDATYDSGYDQWLLWDPTCKYQWEGLKE